MSDGRVVVRKIITAAEAGTAGPIYCSRLLLPLTLVTSVIAELSSCIWYEGAAAAEALLIFRPRDLPAARTAADAVASTLDMRLLII
jgi:hypothetical protein